MWSGIRSVGTRTSGQREQAELGHTLQGTVDRSSAGGGDRVIGCRKSPQIVTIRSFAPASTALSPYQPGRPIDDVKREHGLEHVVKLASNEGPFGPLPAALDAMAGAAADLNRYPDGGAYALHHALAEAARRPGRERVRRRGCGRLHRLPEPGDPRSRRRDRLRLAVLPELRHLRAQAGSASAPRAAARPPLRPRRARAPRSRRKTKIVYICHPNNPTGTMNTTAELDAWFERVDEHVLTVIDQAYFEYIDRDDYPDADRALLQGRARRRRAAHVLEDLRARRPARRICGRSRIGDRAR